jgi:toxin ParE1/3/4
MSYQIVIRPEAEAELADAFAWYEGQRPGLGHELLLSFEAVLDAIRENPESYPVIHKSIRRALIRRFPYGVFYLMETVTVVVVAVFHASRDPQAWRDRA